MNIKNALKQSGLIILLSYVSGFIAWNFYLSHFGFFEYDLLQTRFLSAGLLILFIPIVILGTNKKSTLFFINQTLPLQVACYIFWVTFFTVFLFHHIPQYLGGAKPFLASVVANSEISESFKLIGVAYPSGENKSIETVRGCKIYENENQILIGFAAMAIPDPDKKYQVVLYGVRVLGINKNEIEALSLLPQNQKDETYGMSAYQLLCNGILEVYLKWF